MTKQNTILHCPNPKARKYHTLEEDPALQVMHLPKSAEGLFGVAPTPSFSRWDITFASHEMEKMEGSLKSFVEMIFWLNFWMVTVQVLGQLFPTQECGEDPPLV